MSHWIDCRLFIITLGFFCLITHQQRVKNLVDKYSAKVQQNAKDVGEKVAAQAGRLKKTLFGERNQPQGFGPWMDRSFFVIVRVTSVKNRKKFRRFECGGTLTGDREVITAASCFMTFKKPDGSLHSNLTKSDVLQLYDVDVYVNDPFYELGNLEIKWDIRKIIVKYIDIYRTSESHQQSNVRVDIARLQLLGDAFNRMGDRTSPPVKGGAQPLLPCTAKEWEGIKKSHKRKTMKEEDYLLNRVAVTVGWSCTNRRMWHPTLLDPPQVWKEIVLNVTSTEKNCQKAQKMKTKNAQVDGFCAEGRKFLPKNPKYNFSRNIEGELHSYKRVCENRGGPVFFNSTAAGAPWCLAGIVSGVLPNTKLNIGNMLDRRLYVATGDDWYKGLLITAIENLTTFNLERIYTLPKTMEEWIKTKEDMFDKPSTTTTTTTSKPTEKIPIKSKRPLDRSFFVIVRIVYQNNKSHECAGTLLFDYPRRDKVLTAASCFMNASKGGYNVLDLMRVEVDVTQSGKNLASPYHLETINALYVNVYKTKEDYKDNYIGLYQRLDVASITLEKNAFEWKYREPREGAPQPLKLCSSSRDLEDDLDRDGDSKLYMVGWACSHKLTGKVAMHWQELEIKITAKGEECEEAIKIKSNYSHFHSFCAVGTNMAPKNESRITKQRKRNSDEYICENRGGPVVKTTRIIRQIFTHCLAGVVSGTLPKTGWMDKLASKFVKAKTKFDWYNGIKFTPHSSFESAKENVIYRQKPIARF